MNIPSENCATVEVQLRCLNNFYMNMPGGYYRQLIDDCDEDELRVFAAIDELLAGEFVGLDVGGIMQNISRIHRMIMDAVETGDLSAQLKVIDENKDYLAGEKEKLRPLFNRLVEMGFDPEVLCR